ncbi:hypothetical protein KFE25_002597 [Diacronema lutheri]|uniref:Uncharacterized protein n=1 Tax=Diacronema lutheri TaxID=2081491 RepID=A0A8J6CCZ1_DIALT|nr:hypothetical protein KFE25_002597 [Diacronema lutheri]
MCCECLDYGNAGRAITFQIRIDMPVSEFRRTLRLFWNSNVAAALGVAPGQISIIGITAGSTAVLTEVTVSDNAEESRLTGIIAGATAADIETNWFSSSFTVLSTANILSSPPPPPPSRPPSPSPPPPKKKRDDDDDDKAGGGTVAAEIAAILSRGGVIGVSVGAAVLFLCCVCGGGYYYYGKSRGPQVAPNMAGVNTG